MRIVATVHATPDASREKVEEAGKHTFTIAVKEPAQGGAANARIKTILALQYRVVASQVRLRTGARSPKKTYDVILIP